MQWPEIPELSNMLDIYPEMTKERGLGYRYQNVVLRCCLAIAIDALKFRGGEYELQAMRLIASRMKGADLNESIEEIRRLVKLASDERQQQNSPR